MKVAMRVWTQKRNYKPDLRVCGFDTLMLGIIIESSKTEAWHLHYILHMPSLCRVTFQGNSPQDK